MRHYLNLMTMYKEEDRKIANDILMKLKKSHQVDESDMAEYMNKIYGRKRDDIEFEGLCCELWREMAGLGLIQNLNRKMTLTEKGHIAAKWGMTEFLLKSEKNYELDIKSKESTVWYNRIEIVRLLTHAIVGTAGFLLGYLFA